MDTLAAPDRLGRLRKLMANEGMVPAILVTSLTNVRYLCGFSGSAGSLLVTPERALLVTDGRYETQAQEQLAAFGCEADLEVGPPSAQAEAAASALAREGLGKVCLEAAHLSWARQRWLAEGPLSGCELVPTEGLVETLRRVKDPLELSLLAEAARVADEALAELRPMLEELPTEADFAAALDHKMRQLKAAGPSFETIVASGPNSAKPHHRPGERRIEPGEPVVVDFGSRFGGYCSDMTRTIWVGRLSHPELRRAYQVVLEAQAAGVEAVRAGVAAKDVDRAARRVIEAAGWGERFVHGTGHGVGLDIHEAPALSWASADTLEVANVVTVEPGVYLPGLGGVRIEDTVVVADSGAQTLTKTAKDELN